MAESVSRAFLVWALSAACLGSPVPALATPATCWMKDGACQIYVGKRLWVSIPAGNANVVEVTFTQGDWATAKTLKLRTGASFLVTGIVKHATGQDYAVKLDDGRRGWVGTSDVFLLDHDPVARAKQAAEECARRGPPQIGMTAVQLVASCWGRPLRIVKKTTASGVEESYIYGIGHVARLTDGKITEIIEAR